MGIIGKEGLWSGGPWSLTLSSSEDWTQEDSGRLTAIRLGHFRSAYESNVSRPTVIRLRVAGCEVSVEMVTHRRFVTTDRVIATCRVAATHPDLRTQIHG